MNSVCFKIEDFPELEAVPPAWVDFEVPVNRALGIWDSWGDVDRSYRSKSNDITNERKKPYYTAVDLDLSPATVYKGCETLLS